MTIQMFPRFARMVEAQTRLEGILAGQHLDDELNRLQQEQLKRFWGDGEKGYGRLSRLDQEAWLDDRLSLIRMAVATANFPNMANLVANTGGQVETLSGVNTSGGRQRTWIDTLVLNSQASGTTFGVARLPLFCAPLCLEVTTDTSLGSTTIAFGDSNTAALLAAAATLTATDTPTRRLKTAAKGVVISSGYDSVTGNLVSAAMPQTPGQGGFNYEDINMLTAAAALPASGNLNVMLEYLAPDS